MADNKYHDSYYECPYCGFVLAFHLKGDKYVSYCPFCKGRLEISREEFERDNTYIYFEKDF